MRILVLMEAQKHKLYGPLCFHFIGSKSWEVKPENICQKKKKKYGVTEKQIYCKSLADSENCIAVPNIKMLNDSLRPQLRKRLKGGLGKQAAIQIL